MSRNFCLASLCAAAVLGALRLGDLILFTDAGGFCTLGSAWARYAAAAAFWAVVYLAPQRRPDTDARPVELSARGALPVLAVLAAAAGAYAGWEGEDNFLSPTTALARDPAMQTMELFWFALRLAGGAGWLVFAAWCLALFAHRGALADAGPAVHWLGYGAWLPFLTYALLSYGVSHPSAHRILYIVPVFAFVSAMLLATKLLGLVCVPEDSGVRRGAAASGALCFFLCTCVFLPQSAVCLARGMAQWTQLVFQALPLGLFGCVGAALALRCAND